MNILHIYVYLVKPFQQPEPHRPLKCTWQFGGSNANKLQNGIMFQVHFYGVYYKS